LNIINVLRMLIFLPEHSRYRERCNVRRKTQSVLRLRKDLVKIGIGQGTGRPQAASHKRDFIAALGGNESISPKASFRA
jgi:hypothetical protein